MKLKLTLIIALLFLYAAGVSFGQDDEIQGPYQVATVAQFITTGVTTPAATYLLSESFDGSTACYSGQTPGTCDNTWTVSGDGTIDFAYTGLEGTYGLFLSKGTTETLAYASFASSNIVYGYCMFRPVGLGNTATKFIFGVHSATGTSLGSAVINSNGTTATLYARYGTEQVNPTVATMSEGTTYHLWLEFNNVADCVKVWFSTTGTKPADGGDNYSQAGAGCGGTATGSTAAARVYLNSVGATEHDLVFDKVRVDDVAIGNNPS